MIGVKRKHEKDIQILLCLVSLICFITAKGFGQDKEIKKIQFPKEKVYVHVNSTIAFVGEYLLYSVYCLDKETLRPSSVSTIAYVDLISEDGKLIFQHKVRLNEGRSFSDFFVPTSVASGNYKLLGYTQWMQNFDNKDFFKQNITIINPYTSDQKVFLQEESDSLTQSSTVGQTRDLGENNSTAYMAAGLTIKLESFKFETREKVIFSLASQAPENEDFRVSISVRKIPSIPSPYPVPSNFVKTFKDKDAIKRPSGPNTYPYLPEIRGELLSGRVLDRLTLKPVKAVGVSLSVPGHNSHFKTAHTNTDGTFYFSIANEYDGEIAVIQILGNEKEANMLEILDTKKTAMEEEDFFSFQLTEEMEAAILERSFHNQVENAFFSVKPDTVLTVRPKIPFFLKNRVDYILDDYTRFPTLRETAVEILEHLWIKRESPEKRTFKVRVNPPYFESDNKPLVLIDGLQVLHHESLMDYNARLIEKISVGRGRYVFGKETYDGVISIETFKKDYNLSLNGISGMEIQLVKPQARKNYFMQKYLESEGLNDQRIPDFRYQLLWMPEVLVNEPKSFSFFTADVKGKFEIRIEGFSTNGIPVSLRETILVE